MTNPNHVKIYLKLCIIKLMNIFAFYMNAKLYGTILWLDQIQVEIGTNLKKK